MIKESPGHSSVPFSQSLHSLTQKLNKMNNRFGIVIITIVATAFFSVSNSYLRKSPGVWIPLSPKTIIAPAEGGHFCFGACRPCLSKSATK